MNSFLYPTVPRVNVFRSGSCSQPIRSKNSPSNCHFVCQPSMAFPDPGFQISGIVQLDLLSPPRKTPLLQRSMLSSSEALIQISQCGYQSGYQSRRTLPGDWVASKVTVHDDTDLVNMFLSSISQRCFGLSHQISRCTFQRDKVDFTGLARSLGQNVSLFQQDPCKQISCWFIPLQNRTPSSV